MIFAEREGERERGRVRNFIGNRISPANAKMASEKIFYGIPTQMIWSFPYKMSENCLKIYHSVQFFGKSINNFVVLWKTQSNMYLWRSLSEGHLCLWEHQAVCDPKKDLSMIFVVRRPLLVLFCKKRYFWRLLIREGPNKVSISSFFESLLSRKVHIKDKVEIQ